MKVCALKKGNNIKKAGGTWRSNNIMRYCLIPETVIFFALTALVCQAEIRWIPDGAVVSENVGNEYSTYVKADGANGAFITFVWKPEGTGQTQIMAQHLDAQGQRTWHPVGVTVSAGVDTRWDPEIVLGPGGGIFVVWKFSSSTGTLMDLYIQYLNAAGELQWGSDVLVSNSTHAQQMVFRTASDKLGNALVFWFDSSGDWDGDMRIQKFDSLGNKLWNSGSDVIVCDDTAYLTAGAIAPTGDGGCLVAWVDERLDSEGDIYAQRYAANGNPQWPLNGVPVCTIAGEQEYPLICSGGSSGESWITWQDFRSSSDYDVYIQKLDGAGAPLGPANGLLVSTASGSQLNPGLSPGNVGDAYVVWMDTREQTHTEIYGQRLTAAVNRAWPDEGLAVAAYDSDQIDPVLAPDGLGNVICSWQDARLGGGFQIYCQQVNSAGNLCWGAEGVKICTHSGETSCLYISSNNQGGAVIAWEDSRHGFQDAFAQQIDKLRPFVSQAEPQSVINTGTAQINLSGSHLLDVVDVRLCCNGQSDIIGSIISGNDTQITSDFNVLSAGRGWWNLILTDDMGQIFTALTMIRIIEPGCYELVLSPVIGASFVPAQSNGLVLEIVPQLDLDDTLTALHIENTGTAEQGRDISGIKLWMIDSGMTFDPSTANFLDAMILESGARSWKTSAGFVPIVCNQGERLAITLDVAAEPSNLATSQFAVPVGGCIFALAGPMSDIQLLNPYLQNIMRISEGIFANFQGLAPINTVPNATGVDFLSISLNNRSLKPYIITNFILNLADWQSIPQTCNRFLSQVQVRISSTVGISEYSALLDQDKLNFTLTEPLTILPGEEPLFTISGNIAPHSPPASIQLLVPDTSFLNDGNLIVQSSITTPYPVSSGIMHIRKPEFKQVFHNYPNPFRPCETASRIVYFLPEAGKVQLEVRTLFGDLVRTLINQEQQASGLHEQAQWNGRNDQGQIVKSGTYLLFIKVSYPTGREEQQQHKITVLK